MEKENMDHNRKSSLREWLEKLQQESWQLELLISGLALYGIIEARSLILDLHHYSFEYSWGATSFMITFFSRVFSVAWKLFFINLLIHVVLRGLWIGAIGLRYVSADIDYKELNYSKPFDSFFKKKIGSYDDFIERLEKACSIIFAFTFLIVLLFLSLAFFATTMSIIYFCLKLVLGEGSAFYITMIFYLLSILVFIDFITLGGLKKIKDPIIAKIYFYLYRFISIFTLAFLYRPLLYNFIDHKYTKRLLLAFIPYSIIVFGSSSFFGNNSAPYIGLDHELTAVGYQIDDGWYEDLTKERQNQLEGYNKKELRNLLRHTILSQFYMDQDYPSIFFKYYKTDQLLYDQDSSITPLWKSGMTFSWFDDGRIESDTEKRIKRITDSLSTPIKEERSRLRKEIRTAKRIKKNQQEIDHLSNKRDSFNLIYNRLQKSKEDQIQVYRKKVYQDVINLRFRHLQIYIDDVPYNDSLVCHYYNHPHKGEEGLLCHFSSKTLSEGHHELKVHRDFIYKEDQDISTQKFVIPFIKIR